MEVFKAAVIAACFIGIALSLADSVLTGERLRKTMRLIFSMTMLMAVAAPFMRGEITLTLPASADVQELEEYEQAQEDIRQLMVEETNQTVADYLFGRLAQNSLPTQNVRIVSEIDEYNCIAIKQAVLTISGENTAQAGEYRALVQAEIGAEIDVKFVITE